MPSIHHNFQFSTPFLHGYKILKIPIVDSLGNPAWPQVFPLESIDNLRNTVGQRHFSAQMMLEYMDEDKARLDPGALHFYEDEFDARTAKLGDNLITGTACYWDPSSGRIKSDSSVCVLIYRDDKKRCVYLHDIKYFTVSDNDIHPLSSQCEMVLEFLQMHNQRILGLEVNGIGTALPEIITKTAQENGQGLIVRKITNHMRKETRILDSVEPLMTTGRLFVHERIRASPLLSEMLGWSPMGGSGHDDGIDALAGALRMQSTPVRAMGSLFRPIIAKTDFKI